MTNTLGVMFVILDFYKSYPFLYFHAKVSDRININLSHFFNSTLVNVNVKVW